MNEAQSGCTAHRGQQLEQKITQCLEFHNARGQAIVNYNATRQSVIEAVTRAYNVTQAPFQMAPQDSGAAPATSSDGRIGQYRAKARLMAEAAAFYNGKAEEVQRANDELMRVLQPGEARMREALGQIPAAEANWSRNGCGEVQNQVVSRQRIGNVSLDKTCYAHAATNSQWCPPQNP